jgi:hypothetical protein
MLALDLFNTKYERELQEGAVDQLEMRRIDLLNDRMQELLNRAKEPAYQANPKALAALKKQFQQVKDERDNFYKVREAGIPGNIPPEQIPGKEDLLKGRGRSYYEGAEDYAGIYSPEAIALGKRFCEHYNITDDGDVQLAVEIIDSYLDEFKATDTPVDLKKIRSGVADAFRQVYRGMGPGPTFRKKFQEETQPTIEQSPRALGVANFQRLVKANMGNTPTVSLEFIRSEENFKLDQKGLDLISDYYDGLENDQAKNYFIYRVLPSGDETRKVLKQLGWNPQQIQPSLPGIPTQGELALQEKKKSDNDLEAGDVKVARELQKLRAQYPAARSDVEAVARAEIDSTERSQQQLSAIRGANEKQDALLKQLVDLDKEQGREIDGLDRDNNSLEQRLAQVQATNDRLQQAVGTLTGANKAVAKPQKTVSQGSADLAQGGIIDVSAPVAPTPTTTSTTKSKSKSKSTTPSAIGSMAQQLGGFSNVIPLPSVRPPAPSIRQSSNDDELQPQKVAGSDIKNESNMSELDAMRQDLLRMSDRQFYTAYGISKVAFQQKYRTLLKPALGEHGGGIGPRHHWQDLMQETVTDNELEASDLVRPDTQPNTPPRRAYSIALQGKPGRDFMAEYAWDALQSVFPKEYPVNSDVAEQKVAEVGKRGSAIVKTGIASEDIADSYVAKLAAKRVPAQFWRIVGGELEEATGDGKGVAEGQVSDKVDHRGDVDTSANIEVLGVDLNDDTFNITYNKKPYQVKIQNFSQEGLGRWQIADYDVDIINSKRKNIIDLIDWDNDRQVKIVNTIIAYLDTQQAGDIQFMAWRQAGMANSTAEDLYQEIQDFYKNDKQKIDKATAWLAQNIEDAEERQVFADFVKNPVLKPTKTKYIPKEYLMYVAFSYSREGNTEMTPGMNLPTIKLTDPDDEEELYRKVDELFKKVQFKFDAFENKIIELGEQLGLDSEPDLGSGRGQREIFWDTRIRTTEFSGLNKDMQQRKANAILKFRDAVEKYVASFNNTLIKIGLPGITNYSTWSGVLGDQLTDQQVRYFATPEGFANLASGKIDVVKMIDDNVDKQGLQEQSDPEDDDWYDDEDQDTELRSGDYVRDTMDGEYGEVFRMQGDPEERRVRILDRDGKGWYIEPSRLTRVDPQDPDVQRYFGKKRVRDMDEMDKSQPSQERHGHRPLGAKGTTAKPVNAKKVVKDLAMDLDQAFDKQKPVKKKGVAEDNWDTGDDVRYEEDDITGTYYYKGWKFIETADDAYSGEAWLVEPDGDETWYGYEVDENHGIRKYYDKQGRHAFNLSAHDEGQSAEKWLKAHASDWGTTSLSQPKPFTMNEQGVAESAKPGEYYIHTVYLKDGTKKRIRVTSDEFDVADYYNKRGQAVDRVDYDFQIHSDMSEAINKKDLVNRVTKDLNSDKFKNTPVDPNRKGWTGAGKGDYGYTGYQGHGMPTDKQERARIRASKKKGVAEAEKEPTTRQELLNRLDKIQRMMTQDRNPANLQILRKELEMLKQRYQHLREDNSSEAVERAILNRIMVAHTDLLMKFGPDKVMQAAEEVAYNVGGVDEIGPSDVSAYVAQVKQILGADA